MTTPDPARTRADLVLLTVALGWGASFVVVKDALGQVGPHGLVAARFVIAAGSLALLFPRALRGLDGASLRAGLALGAVLWVAFALQTLGLVHTTPAKSAFLTALYVPLTPLLGRLLFRTPLSWGVLGATGLALLGLALLTLSGSAAQGWTANRGDALSIGCAFGFAFHIVLLDRWAGRVRARPLAILQLGVVGALSVPAALVLEAPPWDGLRELRGALGAVLYLALVCSAFAYWAQSWAQRHTAPMRVAMIFSLESVFAAGFAVGLYGERLNAAEWLGGGLVVAAVLTGQWSAAGAAGGRPDGTR